MSVFQLPLLVENLWETEKELFCRIYEADSLAGSIMLEEDMKKWVEKKFGNLEEVEEQKIVRLTNIITGEGALFNHLRGRRPLGRGEEKNLISLIEDHRRECPFCFPERFAPKDPFGRIYGKYCTTAANVAKYDGYHGLVIPFEHNPLEFTPEQVEDYFQVSARWFFEAIRHAESLESGNSNTGKYPFLMWNCLWPAGSSVVHGHLQLTLAERRHYPRVEWLNRCRNDYYSRYDSNYFEDVFEIHRALGLGWKKGDGDYKVFVSLTPVKEKETWIMMPPGPASPEGLGKMGRMIGKVLKILIREAGVNSFNVALYLPPLSGHHWDNFPLIARLVDRGSVFNRTADFGAMELFATSVISTDPFAVAQLFNEHL